MKTLEYDGGEAFVSSPRLRRKKGVMVSVQFVVSRIRCHALPELHGVSDPTTSESRSELEVYHDKQRGGGAGGP
jgi:hypothetical protein